MFSDVDSEEKAYLLGWIASDATVQEGRITLFLHERDRSLVRRLRDIACPDLPIRKKGARLRGFSISSARVVRDVCGLLEIAPGKKSRSVSFPELQSSSLQWAFVRGLFDGDGSVATPKPRGQTMPYPRCFLHNESQSLLDSVASFCAVPASRASDRLEWSGNNALDFMAQLYDGASICLPRKRDLYLDWSTWVPGLTSHGRLDGFRWVRTLPDAVPPRKEHASDSGYDVTLIRKGQSVNGITFYRTGIKVQPPFGWYFDVVPRSSITKTGHLLANCVGVIDRTYAGEIMVPLVKITPDAPELDLPARVVQLIPRPIVHLQVQLAEQLDETKRADGGFGSTGE